MNLLNKNLLKVGILLGSVSLSASAFAATSLYKIQSYDTGYGMKRMYKSYISVTLVDSKDPAVLKNVFLSFYDNTSKLPADFKDTGRCSSQLDCYNVHYKMKDYEGFLKSLEKEHKFVQFDDSTMEFSIRTSSQPVNF